VQLPDRLFHLAELGNWPSIRRHGLLSASALMDLAGLHGAAHTRCERRHRPADVELRRGCMIREQRRIPPESLRRCLVGLTPGQWYALLNQRVFMWLDAARLNRQRQACAARPQVVLTIDTGALLAAYAHAASLAPINTGNARRKPASRGLATFVPYERWRESGWESEAVALGTRPRPRAHPPVEFTIEGGIPDITSYLLDVAELGPGQAFVPPQARALLSASEGSVAASCGRSSPVPRSRAPTRAPVSRR
jgi:hypothetical protein